MDDIEGIGLKNYAVQTLVSPRQEKSALPSVFLTLNRETQSSICSKNIKKLNHKLVEKLGRKPLQRL